MADTIQLGDEGISIRLVVYEDEEKTIAHNMVAVDASSLKLWLGAPDGEVILLTYADNGVDFESNGSDGVITYATEDAATHDPENETPLLHVSGIWNVQAEWIRNGSIKRSQVEQFEVLANISG